MNAITISPTEPCSQLIVSGRGGFNNVLPHETYRIHLSSLKRDLTPELVALELGLNPEEFETLRFYKDEINRSGF